MAYDASFPQILDILIENPWKEGALHLESQNRKIGQAKEVKQSNLPHD